MRCGVVWCGVVWCGVVLGTWFSEGRRVLLKKEHSLAWICFVSLS
jgi:hypothetical protein